MLDDAGWLPEILQAEKARQSRTLRALLIVAYVGLGVGVLLGVLKDNSYALVTSVASMVLFLPALILWRMDRLLGAMRAIGVGTLISVTAMVALGHGFHDISMMAYPVVLVLAALALPRRESYYFGAAVVGLMLVAGYAKSTFLQAVDVPVQPESSEVYVALIVMLTCGAGLHFFVQGMDGSLSHAHQEIRMRAAAAMEFQRMSRTDVMTQTYNRRHFQEELARLDADVPGISSVIIADIDGLKEANDTYGHMFGDQLVISAADLLASCVRETDLIARIGGDEFAILLPHTDTDRAALVKARIITARMLDRRGGSDRALSMSVGVATGRHGHLESVVQQADEAMYVEKSRSRASA